ncbi:ribosome assembly cofactor RimP [Treponema primitia]|uniref:ribosome assembly cofactor RimP n=1 Tax=Treponema primitia TaxID=88058 RepID=UPI0002555228|nr:ribosome assembly cofactor RimP [Treponema primitia]
MQYTPRQANTGDETGLLYKTLESVAQDLGMDLVELTLSRHKGSGSPGGRIQLRVVVCKTVGKGANTVVGVDDCSKAHRAMIPCLESAFPGQDLYMELSSPGIDRVIKDGSEFVHYIGRGVRCYRTDISDWTGGVLRSADEKGVVLKGKDGMTEIAYDVIAKAKLDYTLDYLREV